MGTSFHVVFTVLTFLASLPKLTLARAFTSDSDASQYLFFNGTVTATAHWSQAFGCGDYTVGPYNGSRLYVGLNPPWDPNPFYFELYHLESDTGQGYEMFTDDALYNLDFTSAGQACLSRPKNIPCGIYEFDYYFVPVRMIDLTKADVKQVDVQGKKGYTVTGDQTTWTGNSSLVDGADLRLNCYAAGSGSTPGVDWDWYSWTWNASTPFTYSVTFSNDSASISIVTTPTQGVGSMTIEFSGVRNGSGNPAGTLGLELVTDDPSEPHFRYTDGSKIYFSSSSGSWNASNKPFPSTASSASSVTNSATSSFSFTSATTTTGAASAATSTGVANALVLGGHIDLMGTTWVVLAGMGIFGAAIIL